MPTCPALALRANRRSSAPRAGRAPAAARHWPTVATVAARVLRGGSSPLPLWPPQPVSKTAPTSSGRSSELSAALFVGRRLGVQAPRDASGAVGQAPGLGAEPDRP